MDNALARVADMTRSVSQEDQYNKCGEQYRLRRVERVRPRPAAWSYQGTAFHSACEVYEGSGRTMPLEAVSEVYSQEYSRLASKALDQEPNTDRWLTAGPSGADDIVNRYRLGKGQTEEYVKWAEHKGPRIWPGDGQRNGIELHLTATLGGVKVQGYIDQLVSEPDGSVRIRDLKTGSTKSRFQLETYALLVRKSLGLVVRKGDWYLAKTGKLSRPVDLSGVTEEEVGGRYAAMDQGVKAGIFEPKPGFNCRFCDVSHACSFKR